MALDFNFPGTQPQAPAASALGCQYDDEEEVKVLADTNHADHDFDANVGGC